MATALVNGRIVLPDGVRDDLCVVLEGDRIGALCDTPPNNAKRIDLAGQLLLPGFIDVQVNGGGGRLFNDDPTVETIAIMAAAHRRFGTTGLLPTLISDDFSVITRAIAAVDEAIEAGIPGILGIHIEGPFLSRERRGIHLASMLQPFHQRFVEVLSSARYGRTLLTVAPECIAPEQIARLVGAGVIVSAGHSDADYETVRAAIDAGMIGFTHLFNAMSQLTNRAPGMVGAALEDRSTYAGVIVDGHHIHPASFRVAINAKGADRLMLVTDAMPTVGSNEREFMLQGREIRRDGDRLISVDGVLAGSTLTMAAALGNSIEQGRLDLPSAARMASSTPAHFLGIADQTGAILPGLRADLVTMTDDLRVTGTWVAGAAENIAGDVRLCSCSRPPPGYWRTSRDSLYFSLVHGKFSRSFSRNGASVSPGDVTPLPSSQGFCRIPPSTTSRRRSCARPPVRGSETCRPGRTPTMTQAAGSRCPTLNSAECLNALTAALSEKADLGSVED